MVRQTKGTLYNKISVQPKLNVAALIEYIRCIIFTYIALFSNLSQYQMTSLQKGKAVLSKTEELSEKFETAFDPLIFGDEFFFCGFLRTH